MQKPKSRRRRVVVIIGLVLIGLISLFISSQVCVSAFLFRGVLTGTCPDGRMRQTLFVDAWSLHRGAEGMVRVGANANFTTKDADALFTAPVTRLSADLTLVKPKGEQA